MSHSDEETCVNNERPSTPPSQVQQQSPEPVETASQETPQRSMQQSISEPLQGPTLGLLQEPQENPPQEPPKEPLKEPQELQEKQQAPPQWPKNHELFSPQAAVDFPQLCGFYLIPPPLISPLRKDSSQQTDSPPPPVTPFLVSTPRTGLTPGYLLPISRSVPPILPPTEFTPESVRKMSPEMVLWLASHNIPDMIAKMPPFRNEDRSTWRALALKNVPPQATQADVLHYLKPVGLECIKHAPGRHQFGPGFELRFLDFESALVFYAGSMLAPTIFDGKLVEASWTPAPPIKEELLEQIVKKGATRTIRIKSRTAVDDSTETVRSQHRATFEKYGIIETLRLDKKTQKWDISFTSVEAAVQARLGEPEEFVEYCKEPEISTLQKQAALLYLGESPYNWQFCTQYNARILHRALAYQSFAAVLIGSLWGSNGSNVGNRCICLTRIPQRTTLQDLCNTVRGGILESVKLFPERGAGFVTFLEPTSAAQFWATYQMKRLSVNSEYVRVGWGRHPGPLLEEIGAVVAKGVTRNLCIKIGRNGDALAYDETVLSRTFSPFGTIEQIRVAPEIGCSFVSFADISSALQAADWARKTNKFPGCEVKYGKDRCAAISRPGDRSRPHHRHHAREGAHDLADARETFGSRSLLVHFLRAELRQVQQSQMSPIPYPILPMHLAMPHLNQMMPMAFNPPPPALFDEGWRDEPTVIDDANFGGLLVPKQ